MYSRAIYNAYFILTGGISVNPFVPNNLLGCTIVLNYSKIEYIPHY